MAPATIVKSRDFSLVNYFIVGVARYPAFGVVRSFSDFAIHTGRRPSSCIIQ